MVHIVGVDHDPGSYLKTDLTLEHFAFRATGAATFETKLRARGEEFRRVDLPEINTAAFNLRDPDGNHIHVDFPLDEVD